MKTLHLLILYWFLIILSVVIDLGFEKTVMPQKLIEFINDEVNYSNLIVSVVDLLLTFVFLLLGTYGIIFKKVVLEWFFVIGNISMALGYLLIGFCVASGVGGFLITCYTMLAGIIIGRIINNKLIVKNGL